MAISVLEEGLRLHPRSSRLLKCTGDRYQLFGHHEAAEQAYDRASAQAEANLETNPESVEDKRVRGELQARAVPPETPSPSGTGVPTEDVSRPQHWSERAAQLISLNDCRTALDVLARNEEEKRRTWRWYELSAYAHAVCYKTTPDRSHRDRAIALLSEGLAKYPRASVLHLAQASLEESTGDVRRAPEMYRTAKRVAEENLRARGVDSHYDEFVVARATERITALR